MKDLENDIKSCFKGKKVFITGHTGFKGSWLTYWLHQLGAQVRGFSLPPSGENSLYKSLELAASIDSIYGDIRDKSHVMNSIVNFSPDFLFHLAAQPLVRESYNSPIETYETNVIGTGNVLLGIKKLKKKCTVVVVTTDKVYENKEWDYPYREIDPLGGYDPYSSSKASCEILVQSFAKSFFNLDTYNEHTKAIATARAGNVIGGGDWSKDRIVPDIVQALSSDGVVEIRNPNAVRPWQHVIEPLAGYLQLAISLDRHPHEFSGAWNFGPSISDNKSVLDLVHEAIASWGSGKYVTPKLSNQPHEANLLKLDISKAVNKLGWKPKFTSSQAIDMTITWYKKYLDGEIESSKLVKSDIAAYYRS